MDATEFYGSKGGPSSGLAARISRLWEVTEGKSGKKKHRLQPSSYLHPFTRSLLGSTVVWKTFPRQAEALEYCQTAGNDIHVFAYEGIGLGDGKRRYLVTSYEHFWHVYRYCAEDEKHHYEVITAACPVKLYFDLEFSREENADRDGEEMVQLFLGEMDLVFQEIYGKSLPTNDLVHLNASTPKKFSSHLILPAVVFRTVLEAGSFVKDLCHRILTSNSTVSQKLLIKKKDGTSSLFVDEGVYNKNRNFRLFQSSKMGKDHPLVLSPDSLLQDKTQREVFFLSLICNVGPVKEDAVLTFHTEKSPHQRPKGAESVVASQRGSTASPFPHLDSFFQSIITTGGLQGRIRQWQYFPDTQTMLYAVSGDYRYCERINRHHKSNNILFVASFLNGTYHQKCMDSDCRELNFRSRDYALPFKVVPHSSSTTTSTTTATEDGAFDVEGDEYLAAFQFEERDLS